MKGCYLLRLKIENGQFRVLLAGGERQPVLAVNVKPVAAAAARERVTSYHMVCVRINLGDLLPPVHGDGDVVGGRIVLRVPGPSAELNGGGLFVGRRVYHGVRLPV